MAKDPLKEYKKKRDFEKTPEPAGRKKKASTKLSFVIQKHHATRLHYDLRLEMDGVLRSWAVPKGPSLDPNAKRLAIAVEDHPLEYGGFEGVIPEGQYGGGKVIIWDHGTYECVGKEADPVKAWRKGKIEFVLHGKKLKGIWLLVKSHGAEENQWLFFKKRDKYADPQTDITQTQPASVISGLEVDEVSAGGSATWNSRVKKLLEEVGAPRREVPAQIRPMLTTLTSNVPEGNAWAYELKYDGVRAIASRKGAEMALYSRNFNPLEGQFPEVIEELREIPSNHFTIDGEITALDEQGRSRFQLIQPRLGRSDSSQVQQLREKVPAYFFAFDLLACEGYDLRAAPLSERKRILKALLPESRHIRYTEDIRENGKKFFELACGRGLEGIIAKDVNSKYESIRSKSWFKIKCIQSESFVIGGFTRPTGSRKHFGAIILGLFQDGDLVFVGKSGSGFNEKSLNQIYTELKKRQRKTSPFKQIPREVEREVKGWAKPDLVAEVKYSEWTNDGRLRAPIFMGLKPDVDAKECCADLPAQAAVPQTGKQKRNQKKARNQNPDKDQKKPNKDQSQLAGRYDFVSNRDKVYWPRQGYTKGDMLQYYERIAPVLLPYLKDRPLMLERYPDGIEGKRIIQKDAPGYAPDWVQTVSIKTESGDKTTNYILCNDRRTLLYVANMGCIALHPWSSRAGNLQRPDFLIIDLDPEKEATFGQVCELALRVKEVAEKLSFSAYPKTSGARGLHVLIPLEPVYEYDEVRDFAEIVARLTVRGKDHIATLERPLSKRQGKVYVDYLQNVVGKTIVSPYCLRPRPQAPVSTPLEWSEVGSGIRPEDFNMESIFRRLDEKGDLFEQVLTNRQALEKGLETLESHLQAH